MTACFFCLVFLPSLPFFTHPLYETLLALACSFKRRTSSALWPRPTLISSAMAPFTWSRWNYSILYANQLYYRVSCFITSPYLGFLYSLRLSMAFGAYTRFAVVVSNSAIDSSHTSYKRWPRSKIILSPVDSILLSEREIAISQFGLLGRLSFHYDSNCTCTFDWGDSIIFKKEKTNIHIHIYGDSLENVKK